MALSIRLSPEMETSLTSVAKQLDRTKTYIVREAIKAYLQEIQEDIEDYNDAVAASKKGGPTYTWEEVKRNCGLLED